MDLACPNLFSGALKHDNPRLPNAWPSRPCPPPFPRPSLSASVVWLGEDDDDDETMSEDEEEDEVREVLVHRAALLSCGTVRPSRVCVLPNCCRGPRGVVFVTCRPSLCVKGGRCTLLTGGGSPRARTTHPCEGRVKQRKRPEHY